MNRQLRLCLLFVLVGAVPSLAQSIGPSTLDAAGASSTISGITYEYAIGQIVGSDSYFSPTLAVTPGVLQPQINTSGIDLITAEQLSIFPDPVENILFIRPAFKGSGILQYQLFDAAGRVVLSGRFSLTQGNEFQNIPVPDIAAGPYLLKMVWQTALQSFASSYKIEKIR